MSQAAADLDLPISAPEIEAAMHSLHPNKNPGLDGTLKNGASPTKSYLLELYKGTELYKYAFDTGVLTDSLREALIVSILKPNREL